jgi:fermentation-respiration switch protein FrsA (DUF1100 family)
MTSGIIIFLLGLLFLNVWMYLQQPGMIFFPYSQVTETPRDWGMEYEEVSLRTPEGLRLDGWFIPHPNADKTLLFFHGNAGNIAHRGDSVAIFHRLGLNVFIFDYRGYGNSEGSPDEQGLYQDARTAWNYLIKDRGIRDEDIVLFGRSLGGVVASRLATEMQPAALIIESTFSSARAMADEIFPILSRVVFLRFRFNTEANIKKVHSPVLVLHSPNDEIIPFRQGQKVFKAANEPKTFFEMTGDHNYGFIRSQPAYGQALGTFIGAL